MATVKRGKVYHNVECSVVSSYSLVNFSGPLQHPSFAPLTSSGRSSQLQDIESALVAQLVAVSELPGGHILEAALFSEVFALR